jgi:threonylcarbamoyladenosine tRNA methylthiotransferase MtaB
MTNNGKRVSFFTLGCRLNQAETALIADTFRSRGYTVVPWGAAAEVSVINTCSVTARADAHCRNAIRRARKASPHGVIAAVGCYAQSDTAAVRAVLGVDYVVGTDRKLKVAEIVDGDERHDGPEVVVQRRHSDEIVHFDAVGYYPDSTRANIKVQDGCDFNCAFCILPRVRGRGRSRPMNDIIIEARALVERGHREIVLAGVSIGSYEFEQYRLVDVARGIAEIDGVSRVRLSSIEPTTIDDDLLRWMAESEKACRHLHIPLQSGNDSVLHSMRRAHDVDYFRRLVGRATSLMPGMGLGTDIIVGFPGEGEAEFQTTVRLVEEFPFTYLHVFSYSDRPKTVAARLPDKNNPETIKARSEFLHHLGDRKKRAFAEKHIGKTVEVLVERRDENGLWNGFTGEYLKVYIESERELENTHVLVIPAGHTDGILIGSLKEDERPG